MKFGYSFFHNIVAACLSLVAMILTIIYVRKLDDEVIPDAPRAFEKLHSFYLAECIRLSVNFCITLYRY